MARATVRQNSTHRPLRVVAFTEDARVDFPTEFPGGVTFKMVSGATVVASGAAVGDASGNLTYQWQTGELATPGTYEATFTATDGFGRTETFPTKANLEIVVIPAL